MKSQYMLDYGKNPDLWPVMIGMHNDLTEIFSVPIKNAVGTNSINNAITLLRFDNDKVVYDEVKRDFIEGVGSGDKYYPRLFSDSWIGYTQTRGFLLFNFKERKGVEYMPVTSGDEYYTDVKVFDGTKLQFLFQKKEAYWPEGIRHLQLLEFNPDGTFRLISEMLAGEHNLIFLEPWEIQNKTIFVYKNDSLQINAFDINCKQISHPFCDLFNSIKNFRCLAQFTIHPDLPFAILVERSREFNEAYRVWLAQWNYPDPDKKVIELLRQNISPFTNWSDIGGLYCSDFEFSPDGKWLVFRDGSENVNNPTFIAMLVDGTREMPLGKPKILGKVMREYAGPSSTAWIKKPLSFVVSDGFVLYKW